MPISVGIELTPSAVRAAVLEASGPSLKLLAARESPCDTSRPEALTQALIQLRQALHMTQPVVLGLPTTSAILTTVQSLVVSPRRAGLAVQFELQQLLPFQLSAVAWDFHQLSPPRSALGALNPGPVGVVIAAMKRSLLDERLASFRRAALTVRGVGMSAVATLNAWYGQRPAPSSSTAALLAVVSPQLAEWIVCTPAALHVIPVLSPSVESLRQELGASWEALRGHIGERFDGAVTLIGSPEDLPGLSQTLAQTLGLRPEPFEPSRVAAAGAPSVQQPQRYVAAIGLALQGLGLARMPLNLLSSAQTQERSKRAQRIGVAASGVCAAAAIAFGLSGMMEVSKRRAHLLQALERRERLYQTLRPDVRALLQQQEHVERRSLQLERLALEAPVLTQVFAEVAEALPDQVWLTRAECVKNGLMEGMLEGRATSFQDVTSLMDRLKTAAHMTTVKPLSTTVMTDEATTKELIAFKVQVQRPLASPETGKGP